MNDLPRQKLGELLAAYGRSLRNNPRRCEGLLRDVCGEYKGEIQVLVNALATAWTARKMSHTMCYRSRRLSLLPVR